VTWQRYCKASPVVPRRLFTSLLGAGALQACGGGGGGSAATTKTLDLWGDSLSSGDWYGPNLEPHKLDRPSAVQLRALLPGWTVIDHSYGGLTPGEALGIGEVRAAAPQFTPIPGALTVIRFGTASATAEQTPDSLTNFERDLDQFVAMAGKRALLIGTDSRYPAYDGVIRSVATRHALPYVDITGAPVVVLQGPHVDQATSDATTALIASAVRSAA
jgi:hypothetical protein